MEKCNNYPEPGESGGKIGSAVQRVHNPGILRSMIDIPGLFCDHIEWIRSVPEDFQNHLFRSQVRLGHHRANALLYCGIRRKTQMVHKGFSTLLQCRKKYIAGFFRNHGPNLAKPGNWFSQLV